MLLEEMFGGEMESAAEAGRVDVFLRQAEPPLSRRHFASELLWREKFLVATPPSHTWPQDADKPLQPQQLLHSRIIMTGRFRPETLLGHPLWRGLGGYPEVSHHVQHPQSLLALVESGAGVGLTTEPPWQRPVSTTSYSGKSTIKTRYGRYTSTGTWVEP